MVKHLNKLQLRMKTTTMLRQLNIAVGLLVSLPVLAGPLQDPTQPSGVVMSGGDVAGLTPAGPVLQSVMLSSGRKAAVISGQMVRVGEKFEEATLVRVTDQEAVLRGEDGALQTLKMHPAVEKKVIKPAADRASAKRPSKRPAQNTR